MTGRELRVVFRHAKCGAVACERIVPQTVRVQIVSYHRVVLASCLVLVAALSSIAEEPPEGFVALFNGQDLTGWEQVNGSKFVAEKGVIKHGEGMGWLCSKEQYGDFILKFEIRWLKDRQDSGIFLRSGTEGSNWPDKKYEVQCENSERVVHIFGTDCRRDPAKAQALSNQRVNGIRSRSSAAESTAK